MELLSQEIKEATKKKLDAELEKEVRLLFFTQEPSRLVLPDAVKGQECLYCRETRQLLEELVALSPKLKLQTYEFTENKELAARLKVDKIPAILIHGETEPGIRFFGLPSGYEYGSLLEALVQVSKGKSNLQDKTKEALRKIKQPVHIQVFVTPTCPYCPLAVELAHAMALESPFITADMVEATEFPHLTQKYHVFGVPKSIINETITIEGAVPENVFLENVLKAAADKI